MARWSAIVGGRASGKPRAAAAVADSLSAAGLSVGGFVQIEVLDPSGELAGWDVLDFAGDRLPLARRSPTPTICDYAFEPAAFERAAEWASPHGRDVVVIGGIGKLEAAGRGHFPVLEKLVTRPNGPHVIACIRDTVLCAIALALPDPVAHVTLPCGADELSEFAERVKRLALPSSSTQHLSF